MKKSYNRILMWILKCGALMLICNIHEYTKYKHCRTISDLFFWPEGVCVDMIVILMFFLIGAWIIRDEVLMLLLMKEKSNNSQIKWSNNSKKKELVINVKYSNDKLDMDALYDLIKKLALNESKIESSFL